MFFTLNILSQYSHDIALFSLFCIGDTNFTFISLFFFVFELQPVLMFSYPGPEIMFSDRHVRIPGHGKLEVEATGRIGVDRDVVANSPGGCEVVCFMLVVMVLFMEGSSMVVVIVEGSTALLSMLGKLYIAS